MSFCTAVNCIDGRVQLPVIEFMRRHVGVPYVDSVTEPGPVRFLGDDPEGPVSESIMRRVRVSTDVHGSRVIAVVAHGDCGGNPAGRTEQLGQLDRAVEVLAGACPAARVLGLWLDESWSVEIVRTVEPEREGRP